MGFQIDEIMTSPRKKHPIIGITTYGRDVNKNFYLPADYVDSVRRAGGLPVMLAPGETQIGEIIEAVGGVIFAGGGDIDPGRYGGNPHPSISRVDHERDSFEFELFGALLDLKKPTLGICRGSQLFSVATGAQLIVHMPDEVGNAVRHRTDDGKEVEHTVDIDGQSRLSRILEATHKVKVISKHHQGLRSVSETWRISAHAPDGTIEAFEHKLHPWMLAVLWHPEMARKDKTQQKLFAAFVGACKEII
jgi:putative glutamine amidotransferase